MADADVAALGEFHGHATLLGGQEAAVLRVQLQVAEQQRQRDVADERQRLSAQLAQERDAMDAALSRVRDLSGSVQTRLAQELDFVSAELQVKEEERRLERDRAEVRGDMAKCSEIWRDVAR